MKRADFSLEVFGDRIPMHDIFSSGEDNSKQLATMKKALKSAIATELTPRQQEMLCEYYFDGQTVTSIANKYGLSKSTVSRHLSRSRERLKKGFEVRNVCDVELNTKTQKRRRSPHSESAEKYQKHKQRLQQIKT